MIGLLVLAGAFITVTTSALAASLLGDGSVESTSDSNGSGQAQAWQYTASVSGVSSSVVFYVDSSSGATAGSLGIYSDSGASPGSKLGSATFTPKAGAWNTVSLGGVSITAGSKYWLVELGTGGALSFRDRKPGASGCASQGSGQSNLTALPSTWSPGPNWSTSCPASFYVTSDTVAAPVNTSPATISGTTQQGQKLTASSGSWSNNPTSYAYQWKDCSASNCANISGAAGSSYMLQSSDVGDKLDVAVTASNSAGSASATSAATQTVTAAPASPLGDASVESTSDSNASGQAQAWQYTASGSGTSSSVVFYVDSSSGATAGSLGIYSDSGGNPGSKLGSATFTPQAGAWNTVSLGGVSITAGSKYWLVELGTSGTLSFRDRNPGASGCASQGSGQSNLAALPSTWSPGPNWSTSCPASFYVTSGGGAPPAAPVNTSAPSISGTAQQGQTLTASTGTWSNNPTSYSDQWQDCSSASSCSDIGGATGSSYTLQSTDVGSTIDVVVTATNAGGAGSATSAQTQAVTASGGTGLSPLHVAGNRLVNANGQDVALHGTDVSGSSYACEQNGGYGFSDTPTGDSLFSPMVSWDINSVVLLLNQDCWLGINGAPSAYSGQNYINFVKAQVTSMEKYGIYPVLVFGEGAPGTDTPDWYATDAGEEEMPNNDHFPLLFEELASEFKSDPNVILKLYEEPYPNYSTDLSTWQCWSSGDVQYSTGSDHALPNGWESNPGTQTAPASTSSTSNCDLTDDAGNSYSAVGMQSLVNIIRGTGATNIIQIPGVDFANALSCSNTGSPTSCGFLDSADGVKVSDSLNPAQLMADTDNYPGNGQYCDNLTCLDDTYAPVAAVMPTDFGEIGPELSSPYSYAVAEQFIGAYDSLGQSYYGSQWELGCQCFITDYNGTPDPNWGLWYKTHITGL